LHIRSLSKEEKIQSVSEFLVTEVEVASLDGILVRKMNRSDCDDRRSIVFSFKDSATPDTIEVCLNIERIDSLLGLLPGTNIRIRNLTRKISPSNNVYGVVTHHTTFWINFPVIAIVPSSNGYTNVETMLLCDIAIGSLHQKIIRVRASVVDVLEAVLYWRCKNCDSRQGCNCKGNEKDFIAETTCLIDDGSMQAHLYIEDTQLTWTILCKNNEEISYFEKELANYQLKYQIGMKAQSNKLTQTIWKNPTIYRQIIVYCVKKETTSNKLRLKGIQIDNVSCQEEAYQMLIL